MGTLPTYKRGEPRKKGEPQPGIFLTEPILASEPVGIKRVPANVLSRLLSRLPAPGGGREAAKKVLRGRMKRETIAAFLEGDALLSEILAAPPGKRQEILCNLTDLSMGIMAVYAKRGKGWQDIAAQDPLLCSISSFHQRLRAARREASRVAAED